MSTQTTDCWKTIGLVDAPMFNWFMNTIQPPVFTVSIYCISPVKAFVSIDPNFMYDCWF